MLLGISPELIVVGENPQLWRSLADGSGELRRAPSRNLQGNLPNKDSEKKALERRATQRGWRGGTQKVFFNRPDTSSSVKRKVRQYPQQHHTLPESSRNPTSPPVLLRIPPCNFLSKAKSDSAIPGPGSDRGPTVQSGPQRGPTVQGPMVPWRKQAPTNPSHPYYSSTPVFLRNLANRPRGTP